MASSDAIAYFGDTLVKLLQDGLKDLLAPAEIFLSTLSDFKNATTSERTVTVFLYNVGTSGETRTVFYWRDWRRHAIRSTRLAFPNYALDAGDARCIRS